MSRLLPAGWDADAYETAVAELHAGQSPYLNGIARLRQKQAHPVLARTVCYIYPPVTLVLLRPLGAIPASWRAALFWSFYGGGIVAVLRIQMGLLTRRERPAFQLLAPFCIFFPGLLYDNSVLGGNIAAPLYGLVALGLAYGQRTRRWRWFYGCVLLVSLVKPPLLTLLVIPPLAAKNRWLRSAAMGALGCMLYALQAVLWPVQFTQYKQLMSLELQLNREFGFSPAGLLADSLQRAHLPWHMAWAACYFVTAFPVAWLLLHGSRAFLAGRVSAQSWLPVLLLGTFLLAPRLMAYDAAVVTLPMLLVAFRCLRVSAVSTKQAALAGTGLFLLLNLLVALSENWGAVEACLSITLFLLSSRLLFQEAAREPVNAP